MLTRDGLEYVWIDRATDLTVSRTNKLDDRSRECLSSGCCGRLSEADACNNSIISGRPSKDTRPGWAPRLPRLNVQPLIF
ncbi:hypothetical protein [Deinococcus yavapaiensis]|uniref:Uncharacterized protein n=1 Tax=Deinococcus yavapaiensis KR-236 TaxID=694435 RepID=A0A318S5D6_9DEIO|nr:hypothetical protein [Deinococcus yavapaiensis]PYE53904.1 hypothetical protein DES52_107162 [Deinococcus yavapaiensis KR-236]